MKGEKLDYFRDIWNDEKKNSTTKDGYVKCPKCGYEDHHAYESFSTSGCEEDTEFECGRCEVKLIVFREVIVEYTAWAKTDWQKHTSMKDKYYGGVYLRPLPEWMFGEVANEQ
jgi:DNA-directed RNA polymerase subunit RPC12/RpoP